MNEKYMRIVLENASIALMNGDVPIGAVIVKNNEIIAATYNTRNYLKSSLGHAELNAITIACKKIGDWRLDGCSMYVNMMPCPMCASAIAQSRISNLYYGAEGTSAENKEFLEKLLINSFSLPTVNVFSGILLEPCEMILKKFFDCVRKN